MATESSALAQMLRRLDGPEAVETDVGVGLQAVVDSASAFFGVAGAGFMLIGDHGLRAAVASDEPGWALEQAQERLGEGPCVDSLVHDRIIVTDNLEHDGRYARLAPEVVPLGVRAVLGMPCHVNSIAAGTLNLYANTPHRWSESETEMLHAFAGVMSSVISTAVFAHRDHVLVRQLQHALDNRVTIERATGVLMARRRVGAVAAFNLLRDEARASRRKVAAVAAEILAELDS